MTVIRVREAEIRQKYRRNIVRVLHRTTILSYMECELFAFFGCVMLIFSIRKSTIS